MLVRDHFGRFIKSKRNVCRIESCKGFVSGNKLCLKHRRRELKHGDPLYERSKLSDQERSEKRKKSKQKYKLSKRGIISNKKYKSGNAYKEALKRQNASPSAKVRKLKYYSSEHGKLKQKQNVLIRQRLLKQATPKWVNKIELYEFYNNTPSGMTVDHIIPLNNKYVSGLHVPCNLQYLSLRNNVIKGNKFDFSYHNEGWKNAHKR